MRPNAPSQKLPLQTASTPANTLPPLFAKDLGLRRAIIVCITVATRDANDEEK
jgi:hypothetical protein